MTLNQLFSICDKHTRILLIQEGKRIFMAREIGTEVSPFLPYPVLQLTYKNQQLRITIDTNVATPQDTQENIFLKDIMPLLEDGKKLALSQELSNDVKKPIETIKLSPLDILIIS